MWLLENVKLHKNSAGSRASPFRILLASVLKQCSLISGSIMKHRESTANTYTEERKKIEIVALFRVI